MANEFVARNGVIAQDNSTISGSLTITNGIVGSLTGTASYAINANLIDGLDSTSFATTTSFQNYTSSNDARIASINTATSSLNVGVTGLNSYTASLNTKTGSFATTSSNTFNGTQTITGSLLQSGNYTTTGTITAQTLVVQTITSSVDFVTGSTRFGSLSSNTHQFTGSISASGSLNVNSDVLSVGGSNVGIGTTSPGYKLSIISTSGAQLELINSATSKSWRPNVDGSDFAITETGVSVPFIIKAGGSVGIGTTSPVTKLDVIGNQRLFPSSGDVNLTLRGFASQYINFTEASVADRGVIGFAIGSGDLVYRSGGYDMSTGTERIRITSGGSVGIGTTSPVAELQVGKSSDVVIAMSNSSSVTSGNRGSIAWYNSSVSTVANIRATAVTDNVGTQLEFYTRPAAGSLTQVMTLDSTGDLGLGVTPSAWADYKVLQLGGGSISSYTDNNFFEVNQNAFWNGVYRYVNNGSASRYQQTAGRHEWYSAASGTANCTISFTQAMTLDASGRLGIGTTSPIRGLSILNNTIGLYSSSTGQGLIDGYTMELAGTTAYLWNYENDALIFGTNNTERMRITSGGIVSVGATDGLTTSTYAGKLSVYTAGGANLSIGGGSNTTNTVMSRFVTVNTNNGNSGNESSTNFYGITSIESALTTSNSNASGNSGGYIMFKTKGDAGTLDERMRITSCGGVVIGGTVASNVGLTIYGSNAATIYQTANTGTGASNGFYVGHTGDVSYVWNYNNYPTVFATNNTERMRITSGGTVGIGTSSPDAGLTVETNSGLLNGISIRSTLAFSSNPDVAIAFRTKYNNAGNYSTNGIIVGYKDNATDGNQQGGLQFYTNAGSGIAEKMRITSGGQVAIGTTSTSAEANLFLGARTTLEGGQLVLQKGTSCSCATHLDNYQDSFRVLVGDDTGSNGVHMVIDHKTRNACFYGAVISSAPNNGYNFRALGFSTGTIAGGGSCLIYSSLDRGLYLISISSSVTSTHGYSAFLWVDSSNINVSSIIRQACVGITTSGRALSVVNQYTAEAATMTITTLNLINYLGA